MKFADLRGGKELTTRVRLLGDTTALQDAWINVSQDLGRFFLDAGGAPIPVEPSDREGAQVLRALADVSDNALVVGEKKGAFLELQARLLRFQALAALPRIVVPLAVLEKLPGPARSDLADWFAQEFVLEDSVFAFAGKSTQALDLQGGFDLIGTRSRWTLKAEGGRLVVDKGRKDERWHTDLIRLRLDALPDVLRDDDERSADLLAPVVSAAPGGSWVEVWRRYQAAERALLEEAAERVEGLDFSARELRKDLQWFRLKGAPSEAWHAEEVLPGLAVHAQDRVIPAGPLKLFKEEGGVWWAVTEDPEIDLPQSGTLVVDQMGDRRRLERRDEAMRLLESGSTRMPDLRAVLDGQGRLQRVDPILKWSSPGVRASLQGRTLTPAQQRAVEVGLNTPDLALIQGPPGTGKTTVIRVIAERLHEVGRKPVLLTSYQHEAVLRALEGVVVGGVPGVRLGGRRKEAFDASLRPMRVWLDGTKSRAEHSLLQLADPPARAHIRAAQRSLAHALAVGEAVGDGALLAKIRSEINTFASPDLLAAVAEAEDSLLEGEEAEPPVPLDEEAIRSALRAQRLTPEAFADDGPLQARRLARLVGSLDLPEATRKTLAVAREAASALPDDFEAALSTIEAALAPRPPPSDAEQVRREALEKLARALANEADRNAHTIGDALAQFLDDLQAAEGALPHLLARYAPAIGATLQQAVARDVSDITEEFDTVIVDEAARASPLDLLIPLARGRRLIFVGDQKQLPHMLEPRLDRAIEQGLAGDAASTLRESFFGRLWDLYADAPPGGIPRCVRLDRQYRMHPTIGRFISEAFYGGGLENGVSAEDRRLDPHPFSGHPIAWFDVPRGRESGRYENRQEADVIEDLVNTYLQGPGSIGVISFYKQQVEALRRRARDWPSDRVEVGTVDAFQGKEFDVVLLSTVRSGRGVGFLRLPNRLNVAMSRARRVLAVVGRHATVGQIPCLDAFHRLCREEGHHVAC
jgi:hypothetical protein